MQPERLQERKKDTMKKLIALALAVLTMISAAYASEPLCNGRIERTL